MGLGEFLKINHSQIIQEERMAWIKPDRSQVELLSIREIVMIVRFVSEVVVVQAQRRHRDRENINSRRRYSRECEVRWLPSMRFSNRPERQRIRQSKYDESRGRDGDSPAVVDKAVRSDAGYSKQGGLVKTSILGPCR